MKSARLRADVSSSRCSIPTLLCMLPSLTIEKLVPALMDRTLAVDRQHAGACTGQDDSRHQPLYELFEALEEPLRNTWKAAWNEQEHELAKLDVLLSGTSSAAGQIAENNEDARLDLRDLWRASNNVTDGDISPEKRTANARRVTQRLMRFWRSATPQNEDVDELARGGRETITREVALAERRRQLRRHAAAGCVEYRIFGEVLGRDDAALGALLSRSNASVGQPETLEGAWVQLGGVASRTGWAREIETTAQTVAGSRAVFSWLKQEDVRARMSNGTAPWQCWWVLPPLQRAFSSVMRAGYAYADGVQEPPRLLPACEYVDSRDEEEGEARTHEQATCAATATSLAPLHTTVWMTLLADTLRRSVSNRLATEYGSSSNLFPLLLMAMPIARLGHIEAAAIYVLARALGSLNAEALRQSEGFGGASTFTERDVSMVEAMNTEQTILSEGLALFEATFASYSVETYSLYFLFSLPLVLPLLLLYLASNAVTEAVGMLSFHGGPDPLDF